MLTIEHCDNLHVHLTGRSSILTEAVIAGIEKHLGGKAAGEQAAGTMQTFATLPEAPPALGELWPGQGGYYAGTMPARDGKPGYHLVLAETQGEKLAFGPYDCDVPGAVDQADGLANTAALIGHSKAHPAALWAHKLTHEGGFDDFYLPAHNELMLMWICAPQLFEKEGYYWTSTQDSPSNAWVQVVEHGNSLINNKGNEFRAVAVRRLAL